MNTTFIFWSGQFDHASEAGGGPDRHLHDFFHRSIYYASFDPSTLTFSSAAGPATAPKYLFWPTYRYRFGPAVAAALDRNSAEVESPP